MFVTAKFERRCSFGSVMLAPFPLDHLYDRNGLKADVVSRPSGPGRMFVSSVTEEYDHARPGKVLAARRTHSLEQRQADRGDTPITAKARLGDQNPIAVGGAKTYLARST